MGLQIYSLQWEYEDELPEMDDLEYDLLYVKSQIIDGVRMFPFIEYWQDGQSKKLYIGA